MQAGAGPCSDPCAHSPESRRPAPTPTPTPSFVSRDERWILFVTEGQDQAPDVYYPRDPEHVPASQHLSFLISKIGLIFPAS